MGNAFFSASKDIDGKVRSSTLKRRKTLFNTPFGESCRRPQIER
jgi:hypothetical protein